MDIIPIYHGKSNETRIKSAQYADFVETLSSQNVRSISQQAKNPKTTNFAGIGFQKPNLQQNYRDGQIS
jgi:hypothetical protein